MPRKSLRISTRPTRPSLAPSPVCDFGLVLHRTWLTRTDIGGSKKRKKSILLNHLGPPAQTVPPSQLSAPALAPPALPHGPPSRDPSLPPPTPSQRSRRPSLLRQCPPARACSAPRPVSGPPSASTGTPGPSSVGPPVTSTQTRTPTRRRIRPPPWRVWPGGYPPPPRGRASGAEAWGGQRRN